MSTPNPMFAKFDQVLGKTIPTPTDGSQPITSRADQIRALAKANPPAPLTGGQAAKKVINQAGSDINDTLSASNPQPAGIKGLEAAGTAAKAIPDVVASQLPQVTQKGLADLGSKVGKDFSWLTDKISNTKLFSDIGNLEAQGYINPKTNPELYKLVDNLKGMQSAGDVANTTLLAGGTAELGNKLVDTAQSGVEGATNTVKNLVSKTPKAPEEVVGDSRTTAWNDIKPKATDKTVQAYRAKGATNPKTTLGGVSLNPSPADTKVLDTLTPLYEDGTIKPKAPTETKLTAIEGKSRALSAQADQLVADNNKIVESPEVQKALDTAKANSKVIYGSDKTLESAYDAPQQAFLEQLGSGKAGATGTDTVSLRNALKNWDAQMKAKFPKLWQTSSTGELSPTDSARLNGMMDTHFAIRNLIAKKLGPDVPYIPTLEQSSNLIKAQTMINANASNLSRVESFSKMLTAHPWWKLVAGYEILKHTIAQGLPGF